MSNPFKVPWHEVKLNADWTQLKDRFALSDRAAALACAVAVSARVTTTSKTQEIYDALASYVADLESREADLRAIRVEIESAVIDLGTSPRKNLEAVLARLTKLLQTME